MARYSTLKRSAYEQDKPCPVCKEKMYYQGYETKREWLSRVGATPGQPGIKKLRHQRRATVDHLLPKSRGGKGGNNLIIMCSQCNCEKGDMTLDEWLG